MRRSTVPSTRAAIRWRWAEPGLSLAGGVRHPGGKFQWCQRCAEKVTLRLVAALQAQPGQLAGGLHPFGNGAQPQVAGQADDGADDGFVFGVGGDVAHKTLVDLQLADLEAFEVAERRIAGAEIVNRHRDLHGMQLVYGGHSPQRVAHGNAFGQFQLQASGGQSGFVQNTGHGGHQAGVAELDGRQVDRHRDRGHALIEPGFELPGGGVHHPLAHAQNLAAGFGQRNELGGRHHAQIGVPPAQQGFQAQQLTVGQRHLGLVNQFELPLVHGLAQ